MQAGLRLIFTLFLVFLFSCTDHSSPDAASKKELLHRYAQHPTRHLTFWQPYEDDFLSKRLREAPAELIDFLTLDNQLNGFSERPQAVPLTQAMQKVFEQAIVEIPSQVTDALKSKLAGVFFVKDLGTTGYTSVLYNKMGQATGAFVVLDIKVLSRETNEWATWKAMTPFEKMSKDTVRVTLEDPKGNIPRNTLQYILLHEFGHVYSIGTDLTPFWEDRVNGSIPPSHYSFLPFSWTLNKTKTAYISIFDQSFPLRKKIIYYSTPKLKSEQILTVYSDLKKTNFVSAYASTNPYDDFAETFASYIHTELMNKPYIIEVIRGGQVLSTLDSYGDSERCAKKRVFMKKLFSP